MNIPPPPITELNMDKSFACAKFNSMVDESSATKEELKEYLKQLFHENQILRANMVNLLKNPTDSSL